MEWKEDSLNLGPSIQEFYFFANSNHFFQQIVFCF